MDAARWRSIEVLFERAEALPADARERLLTDEARRDGPLAMEVRALLAAHDSHHRFLDAPAPSELPAGIRLGPYAVDGVLGSGGMGTVYLAHRADRQFEKKVAIKVVTSLAATLDDRRFRTERQILAALEHPRIARLLDSGVNEFGQPFLVMELVGGEALDVWRRERKPSLEQCLHVWLQVASAVSYAHRNLVVHRDLKPSNVMVNDSGEAKLLDFGIARLLDDPQAPALTQSYTPLYASPEQMRGEPVTTSADIYGLGVLLFELVAGAHPHQREGMATHDLVAAVMEREPAIPLGVPEDLAAILRFALRKVPTRRYLTVDQFTEDVERFERGLPVRARPETVRYRGLRFVQRNRLGVLAAALLSLAVVVGVASTLYQSARAERRFAEVRSLARYLVFDIHDKVQRLPGSTDLQKEIAAQSLRYLDRLSLEAGGDVSLRLELAEGYLKLGDVLGNPFRPNLGETKSAAESYGKGLQAAEFALARRPDDKGARRVLADLKQQLGSSAGFHGTPEQGVKELREALAIRRKLAAESPDSPEEQLKLARVLDSLSTRLGQNGGTELDVNVESRKLREEANAHLDRTLERFPANADLLRQKAQSLYSLGLTEATLNPLQALEKFQSAISLLDRLPPADRELVAVRRQRASVLVNMGWANGQSQAYAKAMPLFDEAARTLEEIAAADPANMAARYHLTGVYRGRGIVCEYAGRIGCAIDNFERAAAVHRLLSEKDPASTVYPGLRGELLARSGRLYFQTGKLAEARRNASAGLALLSGLAERTDAAAPQLVEACKALLMVKPAELRDLPRASRYCDQAVRLTAGKDSYTLEILGAVRHEMGDRQGAIQAIQTALDLVPHAKPGEPESKRRQALLEASAQYKR